MMKRWTALFLAGLLLMGCTGCGLTDSGKINKLITEGDTAFSDKNYQGAVEAYTEALEMDVKVPTAYNNRGLSYT